MGRVCRWIAAVLCLILLPGCVLVRTYRGLMLFKRFRDNQREIARFVAVKEASFGALLNDISQGKLERGMLEDEVISLYGEPLMRTPVVNAGQETTVLFYRHPTRFFTSDKVYLLFDEHGRFVSGELKYFNGSKN